MPGDSLKCWQLHSAMLKAADEAANERNGAMVQGGIVQAAATYAVAAAIFELAEVLRPKTAAAAQQQGGSEGG